LLAGLGLAEHFQDKRTEIKTTSLNMKNFILRAFYILAAIFASVPAGVANPNNSPRILTTLANQNYVAGSTQVTEPVINFTIDDADTAASSFTNNAKTGAHITVTSSNPNLFLPASMATAIGGVNNARTLTLKHEAGITGSATITITINDGINQNTYTFRVTVTPNPYILDVSTLAGRTSSTGPTGYTDGTGSSATFTNPRGATADNRGFIYVQDGNLIPSGHYHRNHAGRRCGHCCRHTCGGKQLLRGHEGQP
jgi:hypothetical protein